MNRTFQHLDYNWLFDRGVADLEVQSRGCSSGVGGSSDAKIISLRHLFHFEFLRTWS